MPAQLMAKADRAARSARILLDAADVEGAVNRAYYAMFDATRAAIAYVNTDTDGDSVKTHKGLLTAF